MVVLSKKVSECDRVSFSVCVSLFALPPRSEQKHETPRARRRRFRAPPKKERAPSTSSFIIDHHNPLSLSHRSAITFYSWSLEHIAPPLEIERDTPQQQKQKEGETDRHGPLLLCARALP